MPGTRVERSQAFALGLMFATGAAMALVLLLVPHSAEVDRTAWLVNALLAVPVAAVLVLVPHRIPSGAYHAVLIGGSVVVAIGIGFGNGGSASTAVAFLFIWVPLYAFWAWDWPVAAAHVAFNAVLLAVALGRADVPGGLGIWISIVGTSAVAAFVVGLMRHELAVLATVDPLTQLPNRRSLHDMLRREIASARRHHRPLALALLDLDDLKVVNDEHGHQAGDEVLRTGSQAWRAALRDDDLLVRFGGDEFVVVMPATDAVQAREVLGRLADASPARFSAGVVELSAGDDVDTLIAKADALLYAGKRAGRRRIITAHGQEGLASRSPSAG